MQATNRKKQRKRILQVLLLLGTVLILLQFIRPEIPHPPVTADLQAPPEVKSILQRACYDCHSNQTQLHWYDQVVPAYWRVAEHVKDGRKGLNFSNWQHMSAGEQKGKLFEAFNQVQAGAMPLKDYLLIHPNAAVSAQDLAVLKQYVAGMVHIKPADTTKINAADKQYNQWKAAAFNNSQAAPSPNGIEYLPDYKNWQVVSTSDRFDNGTMRVIYGNDIAIKAIQENHINPWPNGTIFAKAAWAQLQDADGNVRTGGFIQVEYMIKDDKKYADTKGWGWARWKTPQLKPYGKDKMFTMECINCHRPVKDNDFVFTFPVKQ